MALSVDEGTIVIPAAAGSDVVISGLSGDPAMILVGGTYQTADGILAADLKFGLGIGSFRGGAIQQGYATLAADDGISDMVNSEGFDTDALLRGLTITPAVDFKLVLVSKTSSSITIDVEDGPATGNIILDYCVIGGADVTDAFTHTLPLSTGVATQDVDLSATAAGFGNPGDGEGWLSIFVKVQRTATGMGRGDWGFCLGFDDGAGNRAACLIGGEDTLGNAAVGHWQKTGRSILGFTAAVGTADVEAHIDTTGHPTDGFQLALPDNATIGCRVLAGHLRGDFRKTIGETATLTANGNLDIPVGWSETIRGAILAGGNVTQKTTIDTTHASLGGMWVGFTDLGNESCFGFHENDALGFCDIVMWRSSTKAVAIRHTNATENSDALLVEADASVSTTNLRLAQTTSNATARGLIYCILGDAPAVGGGPTAKPSLMLTGVGG